MGLGLSVGGALGIVVAGDRVGVAVSLAVDISASIWRDIVVMVASCRSEVASCRSAAALQSSATTGAMWFLGWRDGEEEEGCGG